MNKEFDKKISTILKEKTNIQIKNRQLQDEQAVNTKQTKSLKCRQQLLCTVIVLILVTLATAAVSLYLFVPIRLFALENAPVLPIHNF
jgi:hypothetical protein